MGAAQQAYADYLLSPQGQSNTRKVSIGFVGEFSGVLLWPVVVFHACLSILLGWALLAAAASSK